MTETPNIEGVLEHMEEPMEVEFEVCDKHEGGTRIHVTIDGEPRDWPLMSVQAGEALIAAWEEVDRITPETAQELRQQLQGSDLAPQVTKEELKMLTAITFDQEPMVGGSSKDSDPWAGMSDTVH